MNLICKDLDLIIYNFKHQMEFVDVMKELRKKHYSRVQWINGEDEPEIEDEYFSEPEQDDDIEYRSISSDSDFDDYAKENHVWDSTC